MRGTLPSGKCRGPASPGATSRFGGRSPDCSCCPVHGGSQQFTLWPQTKRGSHGGGVGVVRGRGVPVDASPGSWHRLGLGPGCRSTPSSAQRSPGAQGLGPAERPRVEGSRCPWIRPDRADRPCPLSRRGRSSRLPPHLPVFIFLN